MALPQEIRSIYQAKVNSGNIRYSVLPDAAAGAAIVNIAGAPENVAWVWSQTATSQQIAANCGGLDPCWLAGLTVVQSTWVAATTYGDIQVGTGALAAEVWLAIFTVLAGVETAIGLGMKIPIFLPYPIRIAGNPRLCARIRNSTGGIATGCSVKVSLASLVGT
jgi:hypothetical protein